MDDFDDFEWDGPSDSDEEVEVLAQRKTPFEAAQGIKFSKRGLIDYIERFVAKESASADKRWED